MPDGRRRSREGWADAMEDGPPVAASHTHRLPRAVRLAIVGLAAAVFLLLVAVGLLSTYVYQANQYVQGRGEFRDQETERTNERINDAICDLLDQLPEGGLLDRPRAKYGCGPGIPLDLLTPEEQAQLTRPTVPPAAPTPATTVPQPPMGSAAVPNVERPEPAPIPPRTGPGPTDPPPPSPAPDPIVDLGPVTDPLCDALGVCI